MVDLKKKIQKNPKSKFGGLCVCFQFVKNVKNVCAIQGLISRCVLSTCLHAKTAEMCFKTKTDNDCVWACVYIFIGTKCPYKIRNV